MMTDLILDRNLVKVGLVARQESRSVVAKVHSCWSGYPRE